MTQNSSENNKLKEQREVKIIENEHICKNLVSHIPSGAQCFSVYIIDFEQINTGWEG